MASQAGVTNGNDNTRGFLVAGESSGILGKVPRNGRTRTARSVGRIGPATRQVLRDFIGAGEQTVPKAPSMGNQDRMNVHPVRPVRPHRRETKTA